MPLILFGIGLVAGVLSGMFGIGGGVVIVPALVSFLGFTLTQAVGTSLTALLMPVGIFAVLEYYKAGKLNIRIAVPVAVGLIFGGVAGAGLALSLPTDTLQRLYGVFLLYAGWRFIEPRKWIAEVRGLAPPPAPAPEAELTVAWWVLLVVGLGAGVLSGMFGIGGGIVIVPALVGLLRFDQKVAVGTSLGALLFPVGLGAVVAYYDQGALDVGAAVAVAAGLVFGAFGGARLALGLPSSTVKRLYGLFLFFVAFRFIAG
ncbi:MAG: sulfite exporter TauE/SafE family protein [bacterium]|nr:sulfite exporter TauE/SafE family protein [bacterium]